MEKHILNHLHRVQGQLAGVERMVSTNKSCDKIMMQLMAARSSIEQVMIRLLEKEAIACAQAKDQAKTKRLSSVASTLFKYT